MAGSRKGERRGGAKPGRAKTGGRGPGRPNKPKPLDALMALDTRVIHKAKLQIEAERELYLLAIGDRARMPKEVMLSAMRYFEEVALEYMGVLRANMDAELEAIKSKDTARMIDAAHGVRYAEDRLREYISMAVDVGYKVAPYVHARLSAILVNPGANDQPLNAIRQLMRDIDEAGRPARYIDHDASETIAG